MLFKSLSQGLDSGQDSLCGVSGAGPSETRQEHDNDTQSQSTGLLDRTQRQRERPPEDLDEVITGGSPQTRHHALKTTDALGGRGDRSHQEVFLLQVEPSRKRSGWSERHRGLRREKERCD